MAEAAAAHQPDLYTRASRCVGIRGHVRHRRGDVEVPARRAGRAHGRAGRPHRSRQGRRWELDAPGARRYRGGGRLSAHHGTRGVRQRFTGGDLVRRPGVERADAHQAGVWLRAGHQTPAGADIRGNRGATGGSLVATAHHETTKVTKHTKALPPCGLRGLSG